MHDFVIQRVTPTMCAQTLMAPRRAVCRIAGQQFRGISYARVPSRGVIQLKGRDTFKFLQGSMTSHVKRVEEQVGELPSASLAAVLNPQGRMLADILLYRVEDTEPHVLADADVRVIPHLLTFFRRFKLRSKVALRDVSSEFSVFQAWDGESSEVSGASGIVREDTRAPGMGWRILFTGDQTPQVVSPETYTAHRILHGVPEGADDIREESSLPLESCMDYMHGVDYHKGCYIGQELTARTHFTGVTRKRIMPVVIGDSTGGKLELDAQASRDAETGTDVRLVAGERSRSAGRLLSGMHNISLALLRLEHVERAASGNAMLQVETPSGVRSVHAFPPSWWPQNDAS